MSAARPSSGPLTFFERMNSLKGSEGNVSAGNTIASHVAQENAEHDTRILKQLWEPAQQPSPTTPRTLPGSSDESDKAGSLAQSLHSPRPVRSQHDSDPETLAQPMNAHEAPSKPEAQQWTFAYPRSDEKENTAPTSATSMSSHDLGALKSKTPAEPAMSPKALSGPHRRFAAQVISKRVENAAKPPSPATRDVVTITSPAVTELPGANVEESSSPQISPPQFNPLAAFKPRFDSDDESSRGQPSVVQASASVSTNRDEMDRTMEDSSTTPQESVKQAQKCSVRELHDLVKTTTEPHDLNILQVINFEERFEDMDWRLKQLEKVSNIGGNGGVDFPVNIRFPSINLPIEIDIAAHQKMWDVLQTVRRATGQRYVYCVFKHLGHVLDMDKRVGDYAVRPGDDLYLAQQPPPAGSTAPERY